jgi:hypothetical protein
MKHSKARQEFDNANRVPAALILLDPLEYAARENSQRRTDE